MGYKKIKLRVSTAELACRTWCSKSRFYFVIHELHLLFYWWGREDLRWKLHLEAEKEKREKHS